MLLDEVMGIGRVDGGACGLTRVRRCAIGSGMSAAASVPYPASRNGLHKEEFLMKCSVKLVWDNEADVWITESDDVPGLLLESPSFDELVERVRKAAPEMLELNRGYVGPVILEFESERVERALVS